MRCAGVFLCLCWAAFLSRHVYSQKDKIKIYAPRNVTVSAEVHSVQVTWQPPAAVSPDSTPRPPLQLLAYRVKVSLKTDPEGQGDRDHWVPRKTAPPSGDDPYRHTVTCLDPSTDFSVTVLAVYRADSNISEDDASCEMVDVCTKERSWAQDLFGNPVPIVVGAGLMVLIVIAVAVPVALYCRYKRCGRRKLLRVNSINSLDRKQRQNFRKSTSTSTLPSAKDLHDMETKADQHLFQENSHSRPRPIQAPSTADQRSLLIHYSPSSSYQSASSVPSDPAPACPSRPVAQDNVYELDGDVYENLQVTPAPVRFPIKSTSFTAGVLQPRRGGRPFLTSINDDVDESSVDDDGSHEPNARGRRCATMAARSRPPKAAKGARREDPIYGNC